VVEIMNAVHADEIKGMYVEGENPACRIPISSCAPGAGASRASRGAGSLSHRDRDVWPTWCYQPPAWRRRTARLPTPIVRCRWADKHCRCRAIPPHDLWIIQEIANRMGCGWTYKHVSEVMSPEMVSMMPALRQ